MGAEKWVAVIMLDRKSLISFRNGMRVDGLGSSHLCRVAGGPRRMMAPTPWAPEAAISGSALALCISSKKYCQSTVAGECLVSFTSVPMKRNRLQNSPVRLNPSWWARLQTSQASAIGCTLLCSSTSHSWEHLFVSLKESYQSFLCGRANQITGANVGEPRQSAMRTRRSARVVQFYRSATPLE